MTARTFRGRTALGGKLSWAPSALARARPSAERLVTQTSKPAARPSWMSAVAMPPVPPWTSTVSPARSPDLVNSAVGGQPGRAEHGGVQGGQVLGQRDRVAAGHHGIVGQRAVD